MIKYFASILQTFCHRFDQLQSLGKRVASSSPSQANEAAVADRMRQLTSERANLRELWERRNRQLKQCCELQLFLREAEQVDSVTSAQETFLANDDLGVSVTWMSNVIVSIMELLN